MRSEKDDEVRRENCDIVCRERICSGKKKFDVPGRKKLFFFSENFFSAKEPGAAYVIRTIRCNFWVTSKNFYAFP